MTRPAATILCGWAFLLGMMALLWHLPVMTGTLPDTDDYMRMTRVFALLDGQGGAFYAAPRLGIAAQGGSEIGWSRLIDWPLVAVQGALESLMPRMRAALFTASVMPALALLCFLAAVHWYARPLLPGRSAVFSVLAVILLWGLLRQFMPGRVDHHMWQAVLGVIAFGALLRSGAEPARLRNPAIAGAALATGLAVGADIVPWLTFGAAMTGLFWLTRGRDYERAGLVFGAATAGTALALHLVLHDPGRLTAPSCDSLSVVWLTLCAAMAAFWALVAVLPRACKASWPRRLAVGALGGGALLVAVIATFPACFRDPYMISDPLLRDIWLAAVLEARPLPAFWQFSPGAAAFFVVPPLAALAASLWGLRAADSQIRPLWAGLALAMAGGLALTFYQVRTVDFAQAAAAAPLAWLLARLCDGGRALLQKLALTRSQRLAAEGAFFALALALFAVSMGLRDSERAAESPHGKARRCTVRLAAPALEALPGPPLTVAAYIDAGSEILYRTRHRVLAAPYHRDQAGILAAYRILSAADADAAEKIVRESGTDVIMVCDDPDNLWTRDSAFTRSLLGGAVPAWLTRADDGLTHGGYALFKVKESRQ